MASITSRLVLPASVTMVSGQMRRHRGGHRIHRPDRHSEENHFGALEAERPIGADFVDQAELLRRARRALGTPPIPTMCSGQTAFRNARGGAADQADPPE